MSGAEWSALVTGGGSGLGLAAATCLRSRGARVVAVDLDSPGARDATAAADIDLLVADVRDEEQLRAAYARATAYGDLRAVVTCAGVGTTGRLLGRQGPYPLDAWERSIAVNLTGTFNAVRLGAAAMAGNEPIDGDRGCIVMTSSVAAYDGQVGQAAYSAAKAAIAGMTLPFARDLGDYAIRVMTVAPGMFDTALLSGLPKDAVASLSEQVPHPSRFGRPAEFGELVGHIVDNHMLNGEVIRLDGALRMAPK